MADSFLPLALDPLVAPILGEDPRGTDLWRLEIKDKLDEARKEVVSYEKGAGLLTRPRVETPGKWEMIIREGQEYLREKSKDLNIAARLVEAFLKHRDPNRSYQPFLGLAEGLTLVRRLVEEGWDRIYPSIDDGDLEVRATPFNWLDDKERMNSVPLIVRSTPLVGDFWWIDFNPSAMLDGRPPDKAAEDRRKSAALAAGSAGVKHWKPIAEHLTRAETEIVLIEDVLLARMGDELAPTLRNLRNAINDCLSLAQAHLPEAPAAPEKSEAAGEGDASPTAAAPSPTAAVTRADIYERLSDAAARLQKIEPHSPIPYLIQRAVELGQMPFPQLMKALISDAKVLEELNRGLGIKAEPPPPK
jgi:type VI secretion system protein ImpA